MPALESQREPVAPHLEPLATILQEPCPCDRCPGALDCGTRRLACGAFQSYVDGASQTRWQAIERQPTREQWDKLFEPQALKSGAALLRQLAKRSRRPVLTPEQRRERWRLAARIRRARNAQRRELSEGFNSRSPGIVE